MSSDVPLGQTLGRYVVESAIGAGGFATVYRARDTVLDRPVALKVLDPRAHRNPTVARRFLLEGRAVASLDHHAIVPVYDAGEHDDLLWMAMRLVDGPSLDAVLGSGRRLARREVVALVDRIGPALDHAHAQGVVHRDVKPSNILLEGDDPGHAWLADFGIAATARTAGRYTTGTLGTAAYMAPEQARPSEVGPAADVYSLGCVGHELVMGRRPFAGDDHIALLMAHATQPLPATGDAGLDEVLGRALAKVPSDRPASGAAFAANLRRVLLAPRGVNMGVVPPAGGGPSGDARPGPDPDATVMSTDAGAVHAPTVADDRTVQHAAVRPPPPGSGRTAVAPGPPPPPGDPGAAARPGPPPPPPASPLRPATRPSVPASDLPPPRDPTVTRRGRSQARRNLVFAGVALAVAGGAVVLTSLADRGGSGGVRQCDEAGLCVTLPDGWSVGEVQPGQVTLLRDGQAAASYAHQPTSADDPVTALVDAGAADCAGDPEPATVGNAAGARCERADGGVAVAAIDGGLLWALVVTGDVPAGEADDLVGSLEFG